MCRKIFLAGILILHFHFGNAQCCSAGGGCPIAGETSIGVLQQYETELNVNYQFVSTTKFLNGDSPDKNFLDKYVSKYGYYRLGYGLSKNLTMSFEAGYYFDKYQIGLNKRDTISTNGWGDIIVFPRYSVFNKSSKKGRSEITIGLGMKIPLGHANDTLKQTEPFSGMEYYILKPPAIRTTTGAQDLILHLSFFHLHLPSEFRFFTNMLYVKKGWNELGEKAGDYATIGFSAGKTINKSLGLTLQLKGEWIDQMKTNYDLKQMGFFNYDPNATGSKKVLVVPQVSYSKKSVTLFAFFEVPLYQYVNKRQIASQHFFTTGISYRFMSYKPKAEAGIYVCPMHPERTSTMPGTCPECGMNLELKK